MKADDGERPGSTNWRFNWLASALFIVVAGAIPSYARAGDDDALQALASRVQQCGRISDDAGRLRCYDAAAPAAGRSEGIIVLHEQTADRPPADPSLEAAAQLRRTLRIDAGYSVGFGNYAGSSRTSGGAIEADSIAGGLGGGALAEVWLDNWPAANLSLGFEYLQINNRGELIANMPKGVSILTDPVYAHMSVAVDADVAFLNLAYRPPVLGRWRPVLGVGLGVGYGSAMADNVTSNDFVGTNASISSSHAPIAGLQGFVGLETYLTPQVYLSLIPRVFVVSGRPIGVNQRYIDFILGANLGYQFR